MQVEQKLLSIGSIEIIHSQTSRICFVKLKNLSQPTVGRRDLRCDCKWRGEPNCQGTTKISTNLSPSKWDMRVIV